MPNIAALLKGEIIRLSTKSVRQHLSPLQAASAAHRHQIAGLRKQVAALEKEVSKLRRLAATNAVPRDTPPGDANTRFVAKGFQSLRARLGLSAEEAGKLLGVSANSIYNWEQRKARPRAAQMPAIIALRGMGKREVRARLEEFASTKPKAGK